VNGVHDMGGMDGFGATECQPNEKVFHAPWEGRVLAMSRALGGLQEWNIDIGRYWIELLAPDAYLASSYYERWLARLENLLVAHDLVTKTELVAGHADGPGRPVKGRALTQADLGGILTPGSFGRPATALARFKVGDRVRARNIHPRSHTRLPCYVRDHVGVIELVHGCHVFPDAVVAAGVEDPQWLYTVTFEGATLWGPDSEPGLRISVDAFEPYLDAA
jgi:nitrile hydratase